MTFTSTVALVMYLFVALLLAVVGVLYNAETKRHYPNVYHVASLLLLVITPFVIDFLKNL